MKKLNFFNNFNKKAIFPIICLFVFAIMLLFSIFSFYTNNCVNNYTSKTTYNINNLITLDDSDADFLNNFIMNFSTNKAVMNSFNLENLDSSYGFAISNIITQYNTMTPSFKSLYTYNGNSLYNCTNMHNTALDNIPYELKVELQKPANERKSIVVTSNNFTQTTVYQMFSHTLSNINNTIIVEKNTDESFITYADFEKTNNCKLIISSKYGDIIYSSSNVHKGGSNIQNTVLDIPIYNHDQKYIFYENSKHIVHHFLSQASGLNYYILTPYSEIIQPYNYQNYYSLILICVLIVFSLIFLTTLTLKYLRLLKKRQFISLNEFEYEAIKTKELNEKVLDYSDSNETIQKLASMRNKSKCIIVYINPENITELKETYSGNTLYLYKYSIDNVIRELATEQNYIISCFENNLLSMAYVIEDISERTYLNNMKDICKKIMSASEKIGGIISIYVSAPFYGIDFKEHNEAIHNLINYRFFYTKNELIFEEEIINNYVPEIECTKRFQDLLDSINESLNTLLHLNNLYFHSIIHLEYNNAREHLMSSFFKLYNNVNDRLKESGRPMFEFNLTDKIKHISAAKNISEIEKLYESILTTVNKYLSEIKTNSEMNLFQICSDIVNRDFANPSLSSETIAKEIGFSQSHLVRKLKAEHNVSLTNMIRDRRLKESVNFLINTDENISDIIIKCGFTDKSYFTVIFKNKYNMTPSAYRKAFTEPKV